MTGQADIQIRGLRAGYDDTPVLRDLDVDIPGQKVTCILGPSGCGKRPLMKCILGMIRPAAGSVRMLDRNIPELEREELSKFLTNIGVTFQHGALFGSMTIGENVAAPLYEHTDLDEDTIEWLVRMKLGLVGLEETVYKMPSELSGGMQKRVAVARALALDPPVLVLDEPAAGLDPVTGTSLDKLILYLNRTLEITVVAITHEMRSAVRISDKVVFLRDGSNRFSGSVHELLAEQRPDVAEFVDAGGADCFARELQRE